MEDGNEVWASSIKDSLCLNVIAVRNAKRGASENLTPLSVNWSLAPLRFEIGILQWEWCGNLLHIGWQRHVKTWFQTHQTLVGWNAIILPILYFPGFWSGVLGSKIVCKNAHMRATVWGGCVLRNVVNQNVYFGNSCAHAVVCMVLNGTENWIEHTENRHKLVTD